MKSVQRKSLLAVSAAALVLGLAACGRADDRMAATHESVTAETAPAAKDGRDEPREAARAAREEPREAARERREDARDATASADAAMDRAAQDTRAMGAAAAGTARELGAAAAGKLDDAGITAKVNAALAADKELSAIRVDVDTRDGVVTLSGPAPSAGAKARAAEVAHQVRGVQSVNNQLTIKAG